MREHATYRCPAAVHAISVLQGKRKVEILCLLRAGPTRLGELVRLVPLASKKVLVENLRQLQEAGLIIRRDLSGNVRHIEYQLAEVLDNPTRNLLDELQTFGDTHRTLTSANAAPNIES